MRNNRFIKFIKYLNNVYHIDKKSRYVIDKKVNLSFEASHIMFIALICFLLRTSSTNVLNCNIKIGKYHWIKNLSPKSLLAYTNDLENFMYWTNENRIRIITT